MPSALHSLSASLCAQVLTYTEAIELLTQPEHAAAGKFDVKPYWGIDLGSEHERYITEQARSWAPALL